MSPSRCRDAGSPDAVRAASTRNPPRGRSGGRLRLALTLAAGLLSGAGSLRAQGLSNLDYEDLSFRGAMLDVGYVTSSKVDNTASFGGRLDLGFLGPGVRVVAGFNHWSSRLARKEVGQLEDRLNALIIGAGGTETISLGNITWSDTALGADVHFLWRVPFGVLTYAGVGGSAHVLRGSGAAIDNTFVDDLLDSVRAGLNVHGGLELPLHPRFRVVGETRYEVLEDLSYLQFRVGGQFMFAAPAPGER